MSDDVLDRAFLSPIDDARASPAVLVDLSHCGGAVTGLERIALDLFSAQALAPLPVKAVRAKGRLGMIGAQLLALPLAAAWHRRAIVVCPGFPPQAMLRLFGARVIPFIHDCFPIERRDQLGVLGRHYMAPAFRSALRRLPRFFTNSETTAAAMARYTRPDACIMPYRPRAGDPFGLSGLPRPVRAPERGPQFVAIGTVEPRKNLESAARLVAALRERIHPAAHLHVIGRPGWGGTARALSGLPHVTLHGYCTREAAQAIISAADAVIAASHDEGLGLPLLEAQQAGLPIIANDIAVFREVLGASGYFVSIDDTKASAERVAALLARPDLVREAEAGASANLSRWNRLAEADHARVLTLLTRMSRGEAC